MIESADAGGRAARLRSGDASAWEELYRDMYPAMASYAGRRLAAEEARDAVAEAMARAVGRPARMAADASPEAWVFGILRHVVLDMQRRSYRVGRLLRRLPALPAAWPDVDESLVLAEEHAEMRSAFARLSARDQHVLELRVVGGLTAEDAGSILGMRAGAVRSAQNRAVQRLRTMLEQSAATQGVP